MNDSNPMHITQEAIDRILQLGDTARHVRGEEGNLVQTIWTLTAEEKAEFLLLFLLDRAKQPSLPMPDELASPLHRLVFPIVRALNQAAPISSGTFRILRESGPHAVHILQPRAREDWRTSWLTSQFGPESGSLVTFQIYTEPPDIVDGSYRMSWMVVECREDADPSDVRTETDRIVGLLDERLLVGRPQWSASHS